MRFDPHYSSTVRRVSTRHLLPTMLSVVQSGQTVCLCVCRLFSVDVDVEADLCVSYTFKLAPSRDIQLGLGLTFDRPACQLWLVGASDECRDYTGLTQSRVNCLRFAEQRSVGTWTTRSELTWFTLPKCHSLSSVTVT